jgi:hypothetical protein
LNQRGTSRPVRKWSSKKDTPVLKLASQPCVYTESALITVGRDGDGVFSYDC